jgi:hypothetical protein
MHQPAPQLKARLESLIESYNLVGVLVATSDGEVLARVGSFDIPELRGLCVSPEGYNPWIPQTPEEIRRAYEYLEGQQLLPRMAAQGNARAYLMRPKAGVFAVAASTFPPPAAEKLWAMAKLFSASIGDALGTGTHG